MTSPTTAGTRPPQTRTITLGPTSQIEVALQDFDRTRSFLLLHGGGGVQTMAGFAALLSERTRGRVLLPTHPGFGGTPKPDTPTGVPELAQAYVRMLERLDLTDVTVVGNSFGGWLATETALLKSPRINGAVIIDGIGVEVPGHPMANVGGLSRAEILALSFHDPRKAPVPPASGDTGPSPDVLALIGYTGPTMSDPTLAERLGTLDLPVHVLWGESDRIVDPSYGKAYAAAIPQSTFTVLPRTGHLPQVETPEEVLAALIDLGDR